jgi:hypothetical protein
MVPIAATFGCLSREMSTAGSVDVDPVKCSSQCTLPVDSEREKALRRLSSSLIVPKTSRPFTFRIQHRPRQPKAAVTSAA